MQCNICFSCAKSIRARARRYATIASSRPEIFDVVCVGGGPAGLSLLTALRKFPSSVPYTVVSANIDNLQAHHPRHPTSDSRSSSPSPSTPSEAGHSPKTNSPIEPPPSHPLLRLSSEKSAHGSVSTMAAFKHTTTCTSGMLWPPIQQSTFPPLPPRQTANPS